MQGLRDKFKNIAELRAGTQDLEALLEVLKQIHGTMNVEELLSIIVEKAIQLTGAERGCLLIRQKNNDYHPEIAKNKAGVPLSPDTFDLSSTVLDRVISGKEALFLADTLTDADLGGKVSIVNLNIRMVMCAPLLSGEEIIGLIYVDSTDPGQEVFSERRLQTLNALAGQAAIALHQAQLFAQTQALYEKTRRLDEAKMEFIQIASHELRTPITVVRAYTNMIQTMTVDEGMKNILNGISQGVERLGNIVNRMLNVAQIDQGGLQIRKNPYSLKSLLKGVSQEWEAVLAERNQTLELVLDVEEDDPVLWSVDGSFLSEAVGALLQNAIKFSPDGSQILLRLSRSKNTVQIEVIDEGVGIEREHQEAIFEKFYRIGDVRLHSTGQTKFMGAGPGLGLALAKGIIEGHTGSLWVESEGTGKGSRFVILLPGDTPEQ